MNIAKFAMSAVLAASVGIASAAPDVYVPTRTVKDQGISLKGWGSGTVAETDEVAFEGANSIRVSSRNFFQGGILNFASPIDLAGSSADKENLLLVTLQIPGSGTGGGGMVGGPAGFGPPGGAAAGLGGPAGGLGGPRGGGGLAGGGGAAAGGPQGGPPGGLRGGFGDGGQGGGGAAGAPSVNILRIVITTTDGAKAEAFVDLRTTTPDQRGWRKAGVPLAAIAGWDKTNKKVQSVAFSLDTVGTIYVGEVSILKDETPIYAEPTQREFNLALGDQVTLSALGLGGATPLVFRWDFDKQDGVGVDAEGQNITRRFRTPGDFVITLTVVDAYGIKKPFTTEIKITVNP